MLTGFYISGEAWSQPLKECGNVVVMALLRYPVPAKKDVFNLMEAAPVLWRT